MKTDDILSDSSPFNHQDESFDWLKWWALVIGRFCSYLESLVSFQRNEAFWLNWENYLLANDLKMKRQVIHHINCFKVEYSGQRLNQFVVNKVYMHRLSCVPVHK